LATALIPGVEIANRMALYGEITVVELRPIGCVATACDDDSTLAMLVRRQGETLIQLLTRLAQAYEENDCIDEINPQSTHS
jgi:hypothetical protein